MDSQRWVWCWDSILVDLEDGLALPHHLYPPRHLLQVNSFHDPRISAAKVFSFAKDMLLQSRKVVMPHDFTPVVIRIGIHTGPCVRSEEQLPFTYPPFRIYQHASHISTLQTVAWLEASCPSSLSLAIQ